MVDTLVLGTSAKAWEFESLHAHHKNRADEVRFFQCPLADFALSYGADKSALIHWNDIGVAAFCSNLKSVTDLKVG